MSMSNGTKFKIELHVHLDGAARLSTLYELSKNKGLSLPGDGSFEAFRDAIIVTSPSTLCNFLEGFKWILPAIINDLEAIKRITYELCEDKAKDGVVYMEIRTSPHLLISRGGPVSAREVVESIIQGTRKGETEFGIKTRLILCCIRSLPDFASEVVDLCEEFYSEGVVGIDVAGDEAADVDKNNVEHFHPKIIQAFKVAQLKGIHRTVHAGEAGPANGVKTAIEVLGAERIGHGYHIVEDQLIYEEVLKSEVHLETCPYSSILTGAVKPDCPKHPILRFAEDTANFSISTDDPTITDAILSKEYALLYKWGLKEDDIIKANCNAAHSAFLPNEEKQELLDQIKCTSQVGRMSIQ